MASVHVKKDSRWQKHREIPGSLPEKAADSRLPAGVLRRRCHAELPLQRPQYGRAGHGDADAAGNRSALGREKPKPVLKVCYAQMSKQFLRRDPFECVLCGGRMVYSRAVTGLNVQVLKIHAREISLKKDQKKPELSTVRSSPTYPMPYKSEVDYISTKSCWGRNGFNFLYVNTIAPVIEFSDQSINKTHYFLTMQT